MAVRKKHFRGRKINLINTSKILKQEQNGKFKIKIRKWI